MYGRVFVCLYCDVVVCGDVNILEPVGWVYLKQQNFLVKHNCKNYHTNFDIFSLCVRHCNLSEREARRHFRLSLEEIHDLSHKTG